MEMQNIINQSVYKQLLHENMSKSKEELFKELVLEKNDAAVSTQRTTDLTYENIHGISTEEIDTLFKNDEDKQVAKNLQLATQFTQDEKLGRALFNTVLGKTFHLGQTYLFDRYQDKSSFLSPRNSLADLLEKTVQNKLNPNSINQVSDAQLNEILTAVNSFNFVNVLTNTTRDLNNRYKEDNKYSFLYNDYALQYEQLMQKYEDEKYKEMMLLKQF